MRSRAYVSRAKLDFLDFAPFPLAVADSVARYGTGPQRTLPPLGGFVIHKNQYQTLPFIPYFCACHAEGEPNHNIHLHFTCFVYFYTPVTRSTPPVGRTLEPISSGYVRPTIASRFVLASGCGRIYE
ncbi:hypothetical protein AG1IA_03636 [Rhizoctonia solani AG-1 IA]|uniref:Uncharacterized protein n=1 Tax=Thanatephorus cucumeris (strain AG1-IA) TaxID=983506 RepID=L8WW89_THACA|nr:hypothetical protein AG1IA_03636 [Rhizoctonia solani AG-1 IA]